MKKIIAEKIREKDYQQKASKSFYPIRFIKTTYPEYYDMRFAYGNVSIAKFLASSRSDRQLKKTSMYANRHDWWVTSNEGSSDDGPVTVSEVGVLAEVEVLQVGRKLN